ncbi:MAG: hypothetical protein HS111_35940 [Kofleriaceae bacterium]|nr:hypothetical protein [Kofleriaceae bacterium]
MGAVDDVTAQGDLARVLERFRGDPRAALGLDATTDAAAARRAFMALCKVYHPAKFARYAPRRCGWPTRSSSRSVAPASASPRPRPPPRRARRRRDDGRGRRRGPPSGPSAMGSGATAGARTVPTWDRPVGPMPRLRATPPIGVPVTPSTTGSILCARRPRRDWPGDVPVTRPASATT